MNTELTAEQNVQKLNELINVEGFEDAEQMVNASLVDCDTYGICSNDHCNYTTNVEPDQTAGYCEACGTTTVISGVELYFLTE